MSNARFKLGLGREGTNDEATLEIKGSDEWLKETLPFVALIIGGMVKKYGLDSENTATVRNELNRALDCLQNGENYAGAFVTTTLLANREP
jgi:mitochondrial fission protein ELM1